MTRSRIDRSTDSRAPARLRVPASLAVALLGASASVAVSIGGCHASPMPDPVDAGPIEKVGDASLGPDSGGTNAPDPLDPDGGVEPAPDAAAAPPDAPPPPPPVDAYVPPDTPDH